MPRNLSPAVDAAIDAPQKTMGLFLELNFENAATIGTLNNFPIAAVQVIAGFLYVTLPVVLTEPQAAELVAGPVAFTGLTAATWLNGVSLPGSVVGIITGVPGQTTVSFIPPPSSLPTTTVNGINAQAPGGWPPTGWKPVCVLPTCNPGGTGIPTATSQANGASPNLDGNAMSFSVTGPAFTNALWTYIAGANDPATIFSAAYELYIPAATYALAGSYEIDMFDFSTTDKVNYMFGTQYNRVLGIWQVFDAGLGWVNTAITAAPTSGAYTAILQQAHRVPGDLAHVYYDFIVINGTTYWYSGIPGVPRQQAAAPLTPGWASAVGIQFQIDIGGAGSGGAAVGIIIDEANFVAAPGGSLGIAGMPANYALTADAGSLVAGGIQTSGSTLSLALWSGIGPMSSLGPAWDPGATFPYGQIFTGMGWLGRIESVPQNSELTAENMTLQLTGIPVSLLGDVVNTVRLSGTAALWLGFFSSTGQLLADPLALWLGALDVPTVSDGADTCSITITVENALLSLNQSSNRRFTALDQQLDYPGDTGFDYVSAMQDLFLAYPCAIVSPNSISPNLSNLNQAPDVANALTLSPAGPLKLVLGGPAKQVLGSAFFVTGPYINTSQPVTSAGLWSSSDTGVATVSNGSGANASGGSGNWGTGGGLITPQGPGNCTITFFFGQVSCSITVTVVPSS